MDLIERKREEHRSRTLQRVGSVLVCMSLLLAVAFPPQEARAFAVVDDAAIAAIVSAFLSSCGMTFSASGMDSNGVKEQVGHVIDQYLDDVFDGKSALEWFGDVAIGYNRGKLLLPSVLANKLADLAQWVQGEYAVEAGKKAVVIAENSGFRALLDDGSAFYFGLYSYDSNSIVYGGSNLLDLREGARFECGSIVSREETTDSRGNLVYRYTFSGVGQATAEQFIVERGDSAVYIMKTLYGDEVANIYNIRGIKTDGKEDWVMSGGSSLFTLILNGAIEEKSALVVSSADTLSIPETIPDTQEVAISTGAASDLTLDQALDQILAAIAAGQLSAMQEIAEAGTAAAEGEAVEPVEAAYPDVAELGLPELGEALTTRFPFSIPWDVTRAIKLLAAPAKTPYFEVDFFAPVADAFGGFPASTKLVLDFSQFEILGQLSRWTSTIGFCLLLASGTKKLIWTA